MSITVNLDIKLPDGIYEDLVNRIRTGDHITEDPDDQHLVCLAVFEAMEKAHVLNGDSGISSLVTPVVDGFAHEPN